MGVGAVGDATGSEHHPFALYTSRTTTKSLNLTQHHYALSLTFLLGMAPQYALQHVQCVY